MQDFSFNESNLVDGLLFIAGANPGDFVVVAGNGELCHPDIRAVVKDGVAGTNVYFESFRDFGHDYNIRFVCNMNGVNQMKVQYATSTDGEWHDSLNEDDRYMRFSNDGGSTWTSPIKMNSQSEPDYTGELIHNFIEPISSGSTAIDTIVNQMVYPEMWMFCEIMAHYETANKAGDGNFHFTYHHWNRAYHPQVFLNGSDVPLNDSLYEINYKEGYIVPKWEVSPADNLMCTYNFNWFTPETMISFVKRSMGTMNFRGNGQPTNYTTETLPESWYGISADLVIAMMAESLIFAQSMWYGRLIFAVSANDLYNGGGSDIASNLESMKRNAEDRAYSALDNENMRAPAYLSRPTPAYWRAISIGNGIRPGPHGQWGYGKQKGVKYNRMTGMTGPDLGI